MDVEIYHKKIAYFDSYKVAELNQTKTLYNLTRNLTEKNTIKKKQLQ